MTGKPTRRTIASVLLVGDERKGGTRAVVEEHVEWLKKSVAVRVVLDHEATLDTHDVDMVAVFGGDGSILAAVRRMGEHQVPTLGFNLGRLGFLTAFGGDKIRQGLEQALAGKLHEEHRMLLSCRLLHADGSATAPVLALNDGVLARAASAAIVTIRASRGGKELASYAGDGLIVATPTGSTAYLLAAGGPILAPDLHALVLTPLASHTLSVRPLVVPVEGEVELLVVDAGGAETCTFMLDGQIELHAKPGDRIVLREAGVRYRALVKQQGGFFAILHEKLGWADLPRHRAQRRGKARGNG